MEIKGKNVIVTGGAKGIGKLLTLELFKHGANIGVIDTDEENLNQLERENKCVFCKTCDVSNYKQVELTIEEFFNEFKSIDVLINNAAYIFNSPLINVFSGFKKHSVESWNKVINTDLNSVFYTSVNVIEKMIKTRTKGLVVNVSSICANGNPGQSAYSAAKAGIEALTISWSKELGPFGIRIAGIAPGYIETQTTIDSISESVAKEIKSKTPLKRFGQTDEIVNGIVFIIKNDFFNGKMLQLDGGLVI